MSVFRENLTASSRTWQRLPTKCCSEDSAQTACGVLTANPKQTVPTGVFSVPPAGPATPVTATAIAALESA